MIPNAIVDKIFDTAPIEEVVGEYVTLKRAGANFKGLCPFHDDKNPSMSVSPSKGIYKCFSCGKGGNIFNFVMEHEGLSYPLAIKFLADKYNIEIAEEQLDIGQLQEEARQKDGIYACLEFAKNHFNARLNDSQDGSVIYKPYLKERGLGQQSIDDFHIGLSGTSRDHLLQEGLKNGYTAQQLFDAGLVKKKEEGGGIIESNLRDTFIDRIVFPIYNISGKVLGFGGRIIKKDTKAPKYLNSPETLVYEKRKELFGMSMAKNEIRKSDMVYLVEGYMDVVSLYQNGVQNVVAASGTAFTPEQARLIKRFTPNITLLFDGDEAGVNASLKHISTMLTADLNVNIVLFPDGEDPDSYIQNNGHAGFIAFVEEKKQNIIDFILEVKTGGDTSNPIAKAEAARSIAENIGFIPDPLKRSAFISEAAKQLDVDPRILNEETNKHRTRQQKQNTPNYYEPVLPDLRPHPIPEEVLEDKTNYQELALLKSLMVHCAKQYSEEQTVAAFIFEDFKEDEIWPESEEYAAIFKDAHAHLEEHGELNELYFIRNKATAAIAADLYATSYVLSDGWNRHFEKVVKTDEDNFKSEVNANLNYMKKNRLESLIAANDEKLKDVETPEECNDILIHTMKLKALLKMIADSTETVITK